MRAWKKWTVMIGVAAAMGLFFWAGVSADGGARGPAPATVSLPVQLTGTLGGVPYRIRVPADWNGTLLVYAHGYGDTGRPIALTPVPTDEDALLERGFALAASRFGGAVAMPGMTTEGGYQVKEGMQDSVALTAAFNGMVGHPRRTIVWGRSMGALSALGMIEKFPGHYDGAIALCGTGGGATRRWDQALDVTLAYAVAFGWNPTWGTPGDLREDLDTMTEVYPHLVQQMVPAKKGLWEFIRVLNQIPADTYYVNPGGMAGRVMSMYFAFAVRAELERRAGGAVAENIGRHYTLTDQEKLYLAGFGVDANALLDQMNQMTVFAADRNARNYLEHYVDPSGRINRPVLTLHTIGDALATPNHESAYRDTVERAGNGDLLLQAFTTGASHCAFTTAQDLAAVDAMVSWLDNRAKPDPAVYFPATLGFVPNYVPPAWPW